MNLHPNALRSAEYILDLIDKLDAELAEMPGIVRNARATKLALRARKLEEIARHIDGGEYR